MAKTWAKTWDGKQWLDFHPAHQFLPGKKMWVSEKFNDAGGALDPRVVVVLKDETQMTNVDAVHDRFRKMQKAEHVRKNASKKKPKRRSN